jgi:hypothetical protein
MLILLIVGDLRNIERTASDIPIHGARYSEAMEQSSNR